MKKASKIILTIAGIINILLAVALFIIGIVYAVMAFVAVSSLPTAELVALIEEEMGSMDLPEEGLAMIVSAVLAVIFLIGFGAAGIFVLIAGIIGLKGAKAKKKGILIANIVFGVLIENWLNIIGAVLGIIGLSMEAKRAAEPQPEPAPAPAPAPVEEKKEVVAEPVKEEPKQEAPKAREDWFCPNCGAHNTSKFCQSCGTKRPE